MLYRIKAAWLVLRGECTAVPQGPPVPLIYDPSTYGTSGCATSSYTVTATFNPQAAGRRAVRRHGGALRRLAR